METSLLRRLALGSIFMATFAAACDSPEEAVETRASGLPVAQRLRTCNQDPRVVAGLVTAQICAGADLFFRETFNGNGRTCGSCHPAENNFTIDAPFVNALHTSNPADPLFVFE